MATEDNFDSTSDTAGEPFVITTELDDGGTITWTPSRHAQEHIRGALAAGKLAEGIKELQDALEEKVREIEAGMCLASFMHMAAAADSGVEGDFIRNIMAAALGVDMLDLLDLQHSDPSGDEGFGGGYHPHSTDPRLN